MTLVAILKQEYLHLIKLGDLDKIENSTKSKIWKKKLKIRLDKIENQEKLEKGQTWVSRFKKERKRKKNINELDNIRAFKNWINNTVDTYVANAYCKWI